LVGAGGLIDAVRRRSGKGIKGDGAHIDWAELMRFKGTFTDSAPQRTEDGFRKAGINPFHGVASFTESNSLQVGADLLQAKYVLIATGAKPQRLNIPGEEHLPSDQFLELDSLPPRVFFIGGGYVSFEFAHLSVRAGSQVIVLHRGERPLETFDGDLVQRLVQKTRDLGIQVELRAEATAIECRAKQLVVTASPPEGPREFEADMVVHGSGRVADIDDL
jgi:glutathione reductase (NADPH)